jgi:hypothetical protein
MVLGLLVLCATVLVTVSQAALRRAVEARGVQEALQRRWGVVSCRRAVLENAEVILARAEALRKRPVAVMNSVVRLGDVEFELVIADEQAKANVNSVLGNSDVVRAETRIREALAGSGLGNEVKIRATYGPIIAPIEQRDGALRVDGLGQVFDDVSPARLIRRAGGKVAPVELLTCWGSGAVNVRRASEEAIRLAGGRSITRVEVNRLIEARDAVFAGRRGEVPAGERLRGLMAETASESVKNKGNLGLVETSSCHSVWIITRGGRREWYDLGVMDRSNPDRPVMYTHSW